jgi:hypothetical protein
VVGLARLADAEQLDAVRVARHQEQRGSLAEREPCTVARERIRDAGGARTERCEAVRGEPWRVAAASEHRVASGNSGGRPPSLAVTVEIENAGPRRSSNV